MATGAEGWLELPAASLATTSKVCLPSAKAAVAGKVKLPCASVVAVATTTPSTIRSTVEFGSAVPAITRALSAVMPSPVLPVSWLTPVITGRAGPCVSITIWNGADGSDSLPEASVAVVVKLCGPSASGLVWMV